MTTLVFPGQGSQYVGMTKDFYEEFAVVREIFEIIENTSKIKIKDIIFKNNDNLLNLTQYTQLAIFCSSISIFYVLAEQFKNKNFIIKYFLGHSLGEYTALVASKVISIEDCVRLLKVRGELMQNAYEENKSGMAAIIGLNCNSIEKIIIENNLRVEVANDNSPLQVVVSGITKDLESSKNFFIKNGAKKFIKLNVSAAFHSKLMKDAESKMLSFLNSIKFKDPKSNIISNYSADYSNDSNVIFDNLSKQMSNKVKWVGSIKCLETMNETKIIEIGPGKVLSGLINRISNNFDIISIDNLKDMEKFINEF